MNNFEENNKLLCFDGVINRRNYIVNILLVETIIQALFATPLLVIIFKNNNLMAKVMSGGTMPLWWNVVVSFSALASYLMYMPSVARRIRDILGVDKKDNVKFYSLMALVVFIVSLPYSIFPNTLFSFFKVLGLAIIIYLACIKGNVTGSNPKSEVAKFNWGAFIGTWIWGLCNRSYVALWAFPLAFTMGMLPFGIVCGLKGNEWAYDKKTDKDIVQFHAQQKLQSIVFALVVPVLSFVLFVVASAQLFNFVSKYAKSHPDFTQKAIEQYIDTESKVALSKFDKVEFANDEYKFYINPKKWANTSFKQKVANFEIARGYVILQNIDKKNIKGSLSEFYTPKIMNKIKIYSTFNNELLGEYYLDSAEIDKLMSNLKNNPKMQKEIFDRINKGYRFNSHPSLP